MTTHTTTATVMPGSHRQRPANLAVLLSGTGRSLENFLKVIEAGGLDSRIAVVVSSVPGVRGIEVAQNAGIPHVTIRRRDFPTDAAYSTALFNELAPYAPDLVILAGFLRKLVVPDAYAGRILNIHPALLPESGAAGRGFYGDRVHAAVLASGATESGATVHIVDNEYDHGPVIMKTRVPIHPDDTPTTLAARVFAAECQLYPEAIRQYLARSDQQSAVSNQRTQRQDSGQT